MKCIVCGRPTRTQHHWLFGTSKRKLAEADSIKDYCCDICHNMGIYPADRIHGNSMAERLSCIIGQQKYIIKQMDQEAVRDANIRFKQRYGKNYLEEM